MRQGEQFKTSISKKKMLYIRSKQVVSTLDLIYLLGLGHTTKTNCITFRTVETFIQRYGQLFL